ncbi:MAG: hypothetical protein OEM52_14985 [bacterium]|nr:hypothetical protein [bacterium]
MVPQIKRCKITAKLRITKSFRSNGQEFLRPTRNGFPDFLYRYVIIAIRTGKESR